MRFGVGCKFQLFEWVCDHSVFRQILSLLRVLNEFQILRIRLLTFVWAIRGDNARCLTCYQFAV